MTQRSFSWNWRASNAHMLFLQTFLELRPVEPHPALPDGQTWETVLGEPTEAAITRFQVQNALTKATLPEHLDHAFTVNQLKGMLQERNLPTSGRKEELITRLVQADQAGMFSLLPPERLLRCTPYGRQLIEEWYGDPATPSRLKDKAIVTIAVSVLAWLVKEAILPEIIGSAAYDLLTQVDAPAARQLGVTRPETGKTGHTYVTSALKLEWCFVRAGYFWMGSEAHDREAQEDEKPRHRLYLPSYYLGKYPITNRQYQVFVQATGHQKPYHWTNGRIPPGKENHPVTYVYWSDAVAFCRWAAKISGTPVRLLTEAEWEKGARGEKGYRYPWGNQWRSDYCNAENRIKDTTPVDKYPRGVSPYGAYDMVGNVYEWTGTLHRPYPYVTEDGRENMDYYLEGLWVLRGGVWWKNRQAMRGASRYPYDYDWGGTGLGFRMGWSAPSFSL